MSTGDYPQVAVRAPARSCPLCKGLDKKANLTRRANYAKHNEARLGCQVASRGVAAGAQAIPQTGHGPTARETLAGSGGADGARSVDGAIASAGRDGPRRGGRAGQETAPLSAALGQAFLPLRLERALHPSATAQRAVWGGAVGGGALRAVLPDRSVGSRQLREALHPQVGRRLNGNEEHAARPGWREAPDARLPGDHGDHRQSA